MAVATTESMSVESLLKHARVKRNLCAGQLVEEAVRKNEGQLAANGALVCETGKRTGRSPKDRFLVKDSTSKDKVAWGNTNQPFDSAKFEALANRVLDYLKGRDLYVQDLYCGADPKYQMPIRVINEYAWHSLFVRDLFVRPTGEQLRLHRPEFMVLAAPEFHAEPERDGTNSEAFIITDFTRKMVLIGGTKYAGEMKKSIFGVMNFLLPSQHVFPMHCSANIGADGVTALFFGLSGTGKTTLSADPERALIGDDEHGWSDIGIFNFEGGCYAKCIRLSKETEPDIFNAIKFGAVLENVTLEPDTRQPDYNDQSKTENTRAAYPIDYISNAVIPGVGGHPQNIVFLTADAFGVLPPISKLTPEQAMYHFMSGYTAKLAGTEADVITPQPNFSTCFGAPFMPLPPKVYAEMLGSRMKKHSTQCWLVNTGWTGGAYGLGSRIKLAYTRAMVRAAVEGVLKKLQFETEPTFGFHIPQQVPGVPGEVLNPRNAWADKSAYEKQAAELSQQFADNFERFDAPAEIKNAGPQRAKK